MSERSQDEKSLYWLTDGFWLLKSGYFTEEEVQNQMMSQPKRYHRRCWWMRSEYEPDLPRVYQFEHLESDSLSTADKNQTQNLTDGEILWSIADYCRRNGITSIFVEINDEGVAQISCNYEIDLKKNE